jgi:3',5'-cyclic AMP phosphodiesterase CpdA
VVLIFHASDLHFGAEDPAALDWFMDEARCHRPAAIVITGDLTMRARRQEFRAACEWLEALPAPVSVEVGNHDLPYFNPFARFVTPYRRFGQLEQYIERPLALSDVEIVPLMTTARMQWRLNWSKGAVTGARLGAAVKRVAASKCLHRLVACHHPLVEAGTRGTAHTRGGPAALAALASAGATAILSGHVHDPYDRAVDVEGRRVRLIGAGTLSERVRESAPSYNAIMTDGDALRVEVRRVDWI